MNPHLRKLVSEIRVRLELSKRQQFVWVTIVLTGALVATQLLSDSFQIELLLLISMGAYI